MADKQYTEKDLTVETSMSDFKAAAQAKSKLIKRQENDFLFALGDQWDPKDEATLVAAGIKPITDNRIAPNIHLMTGLERQNRTDFKAYPEGEEDGVKADLASFLLKNTIKVSGFQFKSSDQFKDGITCGESHLELYLDYTDSFINGTPCWRKTDSDVIFPEPGSREYDFSDAKYVYKLTKSISKDDLINLFPKKEKVIREASGSTVDVNDNGEDAHQQKRDYPKEGNSGDSKPDGYCEFDLIERYYKKWIPTSFIGDKEKGTITQAENEEKANAFVTGYQNQIVSDEQAYHGAVQGIMAQHMNEMGPEGALLPPQEHLAMLNQQGALPPPPPQQNPDRFQVFKRMVPEIWCFAHTPGIEEALCDERAWFYPEWKTYHFVPYFARFSTAPIKGDKRHLLIQGIVHGVKGVQEKHNKAEMLMLRHLNTSANSGWLAEEDSWVDESKVEQFGSAPGINLYYKKGRQLPQRIVPNQLSTGHAAIAAEAAEAIKAQLGINADLLATQQGGSDSGRAIALRQRQGLLMVQELFDNLSRSRQIAGRFMLSQLGKMYDTESAKKVLGEAFLMKNFPPPMMVDPSGPDPATGGPKQVPMPDPQTGQPMTYDTQMAELTIAEVLSGQLDKYDVSVGESVSSDTQKMANASEIKEIATAYPGLIPPDILIEESQMPQETKNKILASIKQAQAMQEAMGPVVPAKKPADGAAA